MAVSKRLRFEILRRDNHTCRYCGAAAPDVKITVDHVVPEALGGTDLPDNLVAACADCNSGKSATPADASIVDDVRQDALRWAAAMELAARERGAELELMNAYCREFMAAWDEHCPPDETWHPELPAGFEDGIEALYRAGLPIGDLTRALAISMSRPGVSRRDKFRYMCGIAWSTVGELQQKARLILTEERD